MLILKAILFINAFAVVIAAVLIVIDRIVATYPEVQVVINDDKEFRAQGGQSLLRALLHHKYFIPSACGGKGTCGYCKVRVSQGGGGGALPTETLILSSAEVRQGYRLACQLKIREDMRIEIPPEYLEIQEYEGLVAYSTPVTSDIRRIGIDLKQPGSIKFKPGQYVQVRFDTDGEFVYRAYSMASSPDQVGRIELNIKKIPEGIGSTRLHETPEGGQLHFSGPYGEFFLNADSDRKIVCVAGGVGLAPLKSIVLYWRDHLAPRRRPIELYYGARTQADLYDHDLFAELDAAHDDFHYFPALSGEEPQWTGERGFIHTVLEKHLTDGPDCEAYVWGPPIMIDAVTDVLVRKGVPKERILYDKF